MVVFIACALCFALGVVFERVLFINKSMHKENRKFLSSEYLLDFVVEVITIVLACFITLGASGIYNEMEERNQCIQILDQTVALGSKQIKSNIQWYGYLTGDKTSRKELALRDTMPVSFYESIVEDPIVVSNIDMNGHYEVVRYLTAAGISQTRIDEMIYDEDVSDKDLSPLFNRRNMDFYKALINLRIVSFELDGRLFSENADALRDEVIGTASWTELNELIKNNNLDLPVFTSHINE